LRYVVLQGGCTLSNNPVVGVHNISETSLMKELQDRQIPLPPRPLGAPPQLPGVRDNIAGPRRQRRGQNAVHDICVVAADALPVQLEPDPYVLQLRRILVERLQLEEEYERLVMYARDTRFDIADIPTKHELGRVIMDMLHCPMRMNEKVLFMLYFAAMNRLPHKVDWQPVLNRMTDIIRRIGDLPAEWTHGITTTKSKTGAVLKHKLDVFQFDYDSSKQIFNYDNTAALYEVIDLALGPTTIIDPANGEELVNQSNLDWRNFIISYLNCLEYLTLHRDYKEGDINELERRCKKMYTLLVTKIGGLEGVTNYFHYVGSGHVVWMCRRWGNLWRYRNEGVEAFNRIVSLRHNKHNGNGGRKRTREGAPTELCPEFWSLGQWLGRWSMWQLGYGDEMDPDCSQHYEYIGGDTGCPRSEIDSDFDTDDTYNPSPGRTQDPDFSCTNSSSDDDSCVTSYISDAECSVVSVEFEPCTPLHMPMMECRTRNLLRRSCVHIL
jgi:hypothetical protein